MPDRSLGPYRVSPVGLGGMPLSLQGRPSRSDAIAVIHAALEAGITWIDTADVYCQDERDIGHNEALIRDALKNWPDPVRVATKGGLERPGGDWVCNGQPAHIKSACEASLKALGVERIDLYQLHAPDEAVPWAETVGAAAELYAAGKIAALGLSNVSVDQIMEAQAITPIVSVQNRCNLLDRSAWQDGVIPFCEKEAIAFIAYSPVGGDSWEREALSVDPTLSQIAAHYRATPYELALAWLLHQSPTMLVIPGASRSASARSSARAMHLRLRPDHVEALSAIALV